MKKLNRTYKRLSLLSLLSLNLSASKNRSYLKQASPKAANIHNRWLSCRRQRSLRFKE